MTASLDGGEGAHLTPVTSASAAARYSFAPRRPAMNVLMVWPKFSSFSFWNFEKVC